MLQVGDKAPEFAATTDAGTRVSLSDFRGKKVVLYFYPKDDTSGCTREACAFRDQHQVLLDHGAVVLGVSTDGVDSHARFKTKYQLPFPLISDESQAIVNAYGVWKEKNMYGRTYMGTERTTFVLDEDGVITQVFPKVQVDGHVVQVLAALGGGPLQLPLTPVDVPAPIQMPPADTSAAARAEPVVTAAETVRRPVRQKPKAGKPVPKKPARKKPGAKRPAVKKVAARKGARNVTPRAGPRRKASAVKKTRGARALRARR